MKARIVVIFLMFAVVSYATPGPDPDAILGYWHNPRGRTDIRILKNGELYSGVTTAVSGDHAGPHQFPAEGTTILSDFKHRANGVYVRGKVIDIRTGKTYNGQMRLVNQDKLEVRIFFGIIQFGRTETWIRIR